MKHYLLAVFKNGGSLVCNKVQGRTPKEAAEKYLKCKVYKIESSDDFDPTHLTSIDYKYDYYDKAQITAQLITDKQSKVHYYKKLDKGKNSYLVVLFDESNLPREIFLEGNTPKEAIENYLKCKVVRISKDRSRSSGKTKYDLSGIVTAYPAFSNRRYYYRKVTNDK